MIGVRRDCYIENPAEPTRNTLIPAFDEPIDLDTLTPKALALAEAHIARAHAAALVVPDIAVETHTPVLPLGEEQRAAYGGDPHREKRPGGTRQRAWRMPLMRADDPRTAAEWIEHQARENIPPDWYPVGVVRGVRARAASEDQVYKLIAGGSR